MSLTAGQQEYLLEMLSHEYVLSAQQQPLIRQAICRYATTVYDQNELDYLVSMPQSPAACLYYQCSKQSFARQYGLWLNCLEHAIFQEIDGLQAILLNPDPTSSEKLLAILSQNNGQEEVIPLPQLKFSKQQQVAGCSRWTLQECRYSMQQFLQFAHQGTACLQAEPLTWSDLLQQAHLFSLVKPSYTFVSADKGIARPSNYQQLIQWAAHSQQQKLSQRSWLYQPPVKPFIAERNTLRQIKQTLAALPPVPPTLQRMPLPTPQLPSAKLSLLPVPPKLHRRLPFLNPYHSVKR